MKILFLAPYPPGQSPSQRFRFEQYFHELQNKRFIINIRSFISDNDWDKLYINKSSVWMAWIIIKGFLRRIASLPIVLSSDIIFIHREVAPVGPPVFEWLIAKVFRKNIIYDFDDAIWITDVKGEGIVSKMIRWRSKVSSICKWAHKVSCGNEYLCNYARQFNKNVFLNPTTIDTGYHRYMERPAKSKNEIIIGWTGSHSTLKYINEVVPALQQLEKKYPGLTFAVIANRRPELPLRSLKFIEWNFSTEIEDLNTFDIGIMPLPDDEWAKGKCGFKALQYMATGIPTLASNVGVNGAIINNGVNGFLCDHQNEWLDRLDQLINDHSLRVKFGREGRSTVEKNYSVSSNTSTFVGLFV